MAGCPWGVFAVIMLEWVAELQCGAIKRLEDGVGEGPDMITHLGCTQIREKKKKKKSSPPRYDATLKI